MSAPAEAAPKQPLSFKILGRTLEHFGVQMYKRREAAIAELIANCWDAGARAVFVDVPRAEHYDKASSVIRIRDNGSGMSFGEVRDDYLVLGRNRRRTGGPSAHGRRVMGRKGVGKLAGFGLAAKMIILTWRDGAAIEFEMDIRDLKLEDNQAEAVEIPWKAAAVPPESPAGTLITLRDLKHKTPLNIESLQTAMARRFSRAIRGHMAISVNGTPLPDPTPPLVKRFPPEAGEYSEETLSDGSKVQYWYGFTKETIKTSELRGFTIHVNGKTAQAPPFFFDVEATATGQHSTKYVIGEIEADFIDEGTDDDSDLVSTDRQEIDWADDRLALLQEWGKRLTRKALSDCRDQRGEKTASEVAADPDLRKRIEALDPGSKKQSTGS